nr:hypothetical protein [Enhygromyxa salina]
MAVGRQHLPDLPDTRFAICARLAALLDLPDGARAAPDFLGDAAVGDAFADADEHDGVRRAVTSALKVVFNAEIYIAGSSRQSKR